MANLSHFITSSSAPLSPINSHDSKNNYKLSQDSLAFDDVSMFDGPNAVGRVTELKFMRRSGLKVAFKGQHEEWAHSYAGKASLQACHYWGSMLTAPSQVPCFLSSVAVSRCSVAFREYPSLLVHILCSPHHRHLPTDNVIQIIA